MDIKKGKRYKVISDDMGFFSTGEIVVALENDDVPYCVRESDYKENTTIFDYDVEKYSPLRSSELEEIESEANE